MFQVYLSICDNTHSVETGICYLLHFPSYGPLCYLVIIGIVEWRKRHRTTKTPKVLLVGDPKSGRTSLINKVRFTILFKQ